jgi:tetratricopeptide (TPR) repeat protein
MDETTSRYSGKDPALAADLPETEKVSLNLALLVILFLTAAFVLGGLYIYRLYFQPPSLRTALERELYNYQTALAKNPADLATRVNLALLYYRVGKDKEAINELNNALEINPKYSEAHLELGLIYLQKQEKKLAIKHLQQAAKTSKDEVAYYELGKIALKDKNYQKAIVYLEKVIKLNPILADAHYLLGLAEEKIRQKDLAKQHYQEALKYIPDYQKAKAGLARVGN